MRRLAGLVVLALLVAIPAVAALGETASYMDQFSEISYSGDDGTLHFAGPWEEFGDGVTGPESGMVHVGGENCAGTKCLHFEEPELGLVLADYGIERSADASIFDSAQLRFDIVVQAEPLDNASLEIQVRDNDGWVTVKSYDLSKSLVRNENIPLNSYLHDGFAVRFVVPGLSGGGVLFTGDVAIDRVEVSGALTTPTTTSTTTTTTSTTTTTTTISPSTTTSTEPTTTTTGESRRTTTTTTAPTTTSTRAATTTSGPTSTTTTLAATAGVDDTTPDPPEFEPGIHDMGPGNGLMFDIHEGSNGNVGGLDQVEVLSAEVTARFSLAVEAFKSTKLWMAILSLMITAALVSGMDHRRRVKGEFAALSAGQPLVEG